MIYISGKITPSEGETELDNIEKFNLAEDLLQNEGHLTHNPARFVIEGYTWEQYLARDIKWIFDNKPEMYMLKGWEESRGARLEHAIALELGLTIQYQ